MGEEGRTTAALGGTPLISWGVALAAMSNGGLPAARVRESSTPPATSVANTRAIPVLRRNIMSGGGENE